MRDASGPTLHGICRRVIAALRFGVSGTLLVACTGTAPADYAALKGGASAAQACQERLHDGAPDYSECLRYVASHPPAGERRGDWWALGVLQYGWLSMDLAAQHGEDGADAEARALVREAEAKRLALRPSESALCSLLPLDCALQQKRRAERLAGR